MSMEREAKAAAQWWADTLRQPQAPIQEQMGAEDDSPMRSGAGVLMGIMAQSLDRVNDDTAIDRFAAELETDLLANQMKYMGGYGFGTDYHPDRVLVDAAKRAGIKVGMTTFPWKTIMWISPGSVTVSAGYGAQSVEIL
jgi:hypothetical protein